MSSMPPEDRFYCRDLSPYRDVTDEPHGSSWLLLIACIFGEPVFTRTYVWASVCGFYWRGKLYMM